MWRGCLRLDVHGSDLVSVDLSQTVNFGFDGGQKGVEALSADLGSLVLGWFIGFGDLGLDTGVLLSEGSQNGAIWIQFSHGSSVNERVGLGTPGSLGLGLGGGKNLLDGIGIDQTGQVSISADLVLESVSLLGGSGTFTGTEVTLQRLIFLVVNKIRWRRIGSRHKVFPNGHLGQGI